MRKTLTALLLFFGLVLPLYSYAAGPIIFDNRIIGSTKLSISHFVRDHLKSDIKKYDIARVDLNDDYYDEFVLKQKNCLLDKASKQFCTFVFIGEKEDTLVKISVFNAKKIQVSGKKHAGIYDILAFQSKKNDYEYERYIWSPDDKTYIRESI